MHPLFSDRAVPFWRWTPPLTKDTVKLDNEAAQTAIAGDNGHWMVSLAPHAAGGSHSLSISSADGETAARKNLLFGDVWLCSGQSNMAYDLHGALNPEAEIAAANYPKIKSRRFCRARLRALRGFRAKATPTT